MAIFSAALLVIWGRDRARVENLLLGGGWGVLASGFTISLLSPGEWGRAIIAITHVPYTLATVLICTGLLVRLRIEPPVRAFLAVAVTGSFVLFVTQNFGNSVAADLYVTNLTCGAIFVMTCQLFARGSRNDAVDQFIFTVLVLTTAQSFIRPVLSLMSEGQLAGANYRETTYYLVFYWVFAFGSVVFGLSHIAGAMKDQIHALKKDGTTDALSGLLVRGEFEDQVNARLAKANEKSVNVSLVVCDIDHFKQVNDIWGHQAGDKAIGDFGRMITGMIRDTDIAGRIGGEEFCVLVWNASEKDAAGLAERLRHRAKTLAISEDSLDARLSASFGVVERKRSEGYRSLFGRADKALYEAKQAGRDCVIRGEETDVSKAERSEQSSAAA
ncbi:MAG: GGDEF domain-containing protein [Pseudomonadota bacterium]